MTKERKENLLNFINSALEHLNNIKNDVENNRLVKGLDLLCVERDTDMLLEMITGEEKNDRLWI